VQFLEEILFGLAIISVSQDSRARNKTDRVVESSSRFPISTGHWKLSFSSLKTGEDPDDGGGACRSS
jgi:hypothetical protein